MLKKTLLASIPILLSACNGPITPQEVATATAYQQQIAGACSVAMTLAPASGPVAPWIIGGCSSEELIARLALDPNSLNWVNSLIVKAQTHT